MKFRFRLERVRKYRQTVEDEAKRELVLARLELQRGLEAISAMGGNIKKGYNVISDLLRQGGGIETLKMMDAYIEGTRVKIEQKSDEMQNQKIIVDQKMAVFLEARKKRAALDKLEERQVVRFKDTEKKREEKQLDELVVSRQHKETAA